MDFFEAQEAARKRTGWLIALFGAAVVAIIAVVYAVVHLAIGPGAGPVDWVLLLQVALGVGLVIAAGSTVRTARLRQGGGAVAELLGGRRVDPMTTDPAERKLVNIVEEMALASGTPVPAIYVLDREQGINAFAAGYATHDAAVAVTQGALLALTRDELQGVIAHEFSHILNGDMRLNIRLMGVLFGILLLAIIGRTIVYAGPRGGRGRGRDGAGWVVLLGLALLLVGYVGVFFGRMIKAGVSRQREYLADSAAVQFTRNPEGLAGALKKIGAQAAGSRIHDPHAEEASHLFFANGLRRSVFGFLSTHPPLAARIRRLDPSWDGDFDSVAADPLPAVEHRRPAQQAGFAEVAAGAASAASAVAPADPRGLVASVGAPTSEHLAHAAALLERLPEPLHLAAHDPVAARALVFALVLADTDEPLPEQRLAIREHGGDAMVDRVDALLPGVRAQGAGAALPLLDLALPALQRLAPDEARRFRAAVDRAIHADGRVRPFEFALAHTLGRRLGGEEAAKSPGVGRTTSLEPLRMEVEAVLSAVAWAGSGGREDAAERAFRAGVRRLPASFRSLRRQAVGGIDLIGVDRALTALESASPAAKRLLLEACADAAAHDGRLDPREAELLRAVAESLDCPMPPLLPGR